jgi:hypothetical protein
MKRAISVIAVGAFVVALSVSAGHADVVTSYNATFSSGSGDSLISASATIKIDLTTGAVTVALTDDNADPRATGNLVSGIQLVFSNAVNSPSSFSGSGTLVNLTQGTCSGGGVGHCTYTAAATGSTNLTEWKDTTASSTLQLTALGGGNQSQMIIGSGPYTNGNSQLDHDEPYVLTTGKFGVTVAGLVDGTGLVPETTLSGVNFNFGTTLAWQSAIVTTPVGTAPVPLHSPWQTTLLGVGVLGFMAYWRKKRIAMIAA